MIFYRDAEGRFYPTQADARAVDKNFTQTDVPVSKPELLVFLNQMQELILSTEKVADTVHEALWEAEVALVEPVIERVVETVPADLAGAVLELEGTSLIRVLSAAITRLGETAGFHGWAAFAKDVYRWTPAARSTEQGLGMLMLSALGILDKGAEPAAVTQNMDVQEAA